MKKDNQWLEHWLGTEKGFATASRLYECWFSALTRLPARVLGALDGAASPSKDYFLRLLSIGPDDVMAVSGCGKAAALTACRHLLDFRSRLIEAFFEDLAQSSSHVFSREGRDWVPHHEMQYLKEEIDRMSEGMSTRSRRVVGALFKKNKYDVGLLYRTLTGKGFNCRDLRGVGPVIYPGVRQWCERVISLVQDSLGARFPYRLLREPALFIASPNPRRKPGREVR